MVKHVLSAHSDTFKPWLLALASGVLAFCVTISGCAERLDWIAYEMHFASDSTKPARVVLSEIDEAALKRHGGWPLDRSLYVTAARNALAAGASAVVIDVMFDRNRSAPGDELLADFVRKNKRVALAYRSRMSEGPRFYPQLAMAGPTAGHVDVFGGVRDDVVVMIIDVPQETSLALVAASLYCEAAVPRCSPSVRTSRLDMVYRKRPTHVWGINFHSPHSAFPRTSFDALLAGKLEPLGGKVLVISPTAESLGDNYWLPQGSKQLFLPGSIALAYAIETAVAGTSLFVAPAWLLLLCVAVANAAMLFVARGLPRYRNVLLAAYLSLAVAGHWALFHWIQLHVPISFCLANGIGLWIATRITWPEAGQGDGTHNAAAVDSDFLSSRYKQ